MNTKITVHSKETLNVIHKQKHTQYEYKKYVATNKETSHYTVAIYDIPPQKSNYPYHYHTKDDEIFYIIKGIGTLETPEGNKEIKAGDIIICPPCDKGAHKLTNISSTETLSYIEFDITHKPEVVIYPHTNKIGVIGLEEDNIFFQKDTRVNYYDGEDN